MTENKYGIVIVSYKPPDLLLDLVKQLTIFKEVNVYIVDSSPQCIQLELEEKINRNVSEHSKDRVTIIKTKNLGAGYSLNLGIKKCIEEGMKLITIMDDDTILVKGNFNPTAISSFFFTKMNPMKDVLILAQGIQSEIKFWVETGLTFTEDVFNAVQFREDFIMDQIDSLFCLKVRERGGHLIIFPLPVLQNIPIGREVNGNVASLPTYRIYTLTRNSLTMAFESKEKLSLLVFAITQISYWCLRSIQGKKDFLLLTKALYWGVLDFLRGNYGITDKLNYLSSNRFNEI
jgi:hypothetical protein